MTAAAEAGRRSDGSRRAGPGESGRRAAGHRPARPGEGSFFLSGEFHYFRVPRQDWDARLSSCRAAGLAAVSIYVPWNWHVPEPGTIDLDGATLAERNLRGALDSIAASGLDCIIRPGPFITAEWRNGGLPDWLLGSHPEIIATSAAGQPSLGGGYPAVTYAHPAFVSHVEEWLEQVFDVAGGYLAGTGGPIIGVQLDDEPSYFQKLVDPMAVDYNPFLVEKGLSDVNLSVWAQWLASRYDGLEDLSDAHSNPYRSWDTVTPPRVPMSSREQLPLYLDWLAFKLHQIDEFVRMLHLLVTRLAPGAPVSVLYPYLQPLLAGEFARFAAKEELDLQLTNECYLALNAPDGCGEQKLGAIVACHEVYNMWRGSSQGPAVSMELQSSNATYIAPGTMEMLYAATVARGIDGVNFFMMVGGYNPPGYENDTGAHYDIAAPVALDGSTRPHYATIAKFSRVLRVLGPHLDRTLPLYDTWIGCYGGYEAAAMAGAAFLYDAWGHQVLGNLGDMGLADANSLAALMALSSVSFGCIDVEHGIDGSHLRGVGAATYRGAVRQIWVPALEFMPERIQRALASFVRGGGHLILLPTVPSVDEYARPCGVLRALAFGDPGGGGEIAGYSEEWNEHCVVNGPAGESLVAPGRASSLVPPTGAEVIATRARDGSPCGFTRPVGDGRVTFLGFRLQYAPGADPAQHSFVTALVEQSAGPRHAWAERVPLVAMQRSGGRGEEGGGGSGRGGEAGGLLCVVDPVSIGAAARVWYTDPRSPEERVPLPVVLPSLALPGRGGLLLPLRLTLGSGWVLCHSTWEVIGLETAPGRCVLELSVPPFPGCRVVEGEILLEGPTASVTAAGGEVRQQVDLEGGRRAVVLASAGPSVMVTIDAR